MSPNDELALVMLVAAARRDPFDAEALLSTARAFGVGPCPDCDFIERRCRCVLPKVSS